MKISIFYDAACPSCVKDREQYCKLSNEPDSLEWLDINDKNLDLKQYGIEPLKALTELHILVEHENGRQEVLAELDAYILLMQRVWLLKPFALIISLPIVRQILSFVYRSWVHKRLKKQGRL